MPYTPVVADLLQIKVGTYAFGQAGINVTHWVVDAVTNGGITQREIAENMDAEFAPLYKALMHNTASYYGTQVQKILPVPVAVSEQDADLIGVGVAGPEPLPGQVSGVITLQTNFAGRANRGRIFVPFPSSQDDEVTTNRPTDAYVIRLGALMQIYKEASECISGLSSTTIAPVIFHRGNGTFTRVTSGIARQKWGTQRRRGNYGQGNVYPPF